MLSNFWPPNSSQFSLSLINYLNNILNYGVYELSIIPKPIHCDLKLNDVQRKARKLSIIALILMIIGSVAFDQFTKYKSQDTLMVSSSETDLRVYRGKLYPIMSLGTENARTDGPYLALNFSYVRNPGAAWGFLASMDDKYRVPFFHVITLLSILLIVQYLRLTPWSHLLGRFALALILSGALGNMLDRFVLNYVIDWIDVRWNFFGWYYAFPNFNFADAAISVGAFLFFIDVLFLEKKRRAKADKNAVNADSKPVDV